MADGVKKLINAVRDVYLDSKVHRLSSTKKAGCEHSGQRLVLLT